MAKIVNEEQYWAFISYDSEDRRWADWLFHGLEQYLIPRHLQGRRVSDIPIPKRLRPVFFDHGELPAGGSLEQEILGALGRSRTLIVVCSPKSAASPWVDREVREFRAMGRGDRIYCLLIAGEPGSHDPGCEAFCPALTQSGNESLPIAADVRDASAGTKKIALLRLVAGILRVGFDELWHREKRRTVTRFWIELLVGFGLLCTTLLVVEAVMVPALDTTKTSGSRIAVASLINSALSLDQEIALHKFALDSFQRDMAEEVGQNPTLNGEAQIRRLSRNLPTMRAVTFRWRGQQQIAAREDLPERDAVIGLIGGNRPDSAPEIEVFRAPDGPVLMMVREGLRNELPAVAASFLLLAPDDAVVLDHAGKVVWTGRRVDGERLEEGATKLWREARGTRMSTRTRINGEEFADNIVQVRNGDLSLWTRVSLYESSLLKKSTRFIQAAVAALWLVILIVRAVLLFRTYRRAPVRNLERTDGLTPRDRLKPPILN